MRKEACKFLHSKMTPYPNKKILDELSSIYGEDVVLGGMMNLRRVTKKLWKSKNHKEKKLWKKSLD